MPQNRIDIKKDEVAAEIARLISDMQDVAYDVVLDELEKNLAFEDGKVKITSGFIQKLDNITNRIMIRLQQSTDFAGAVSKFIKRMPEISKEIEQFQLTKNGIKVPAFESAKKVVIDEVINQMLKNGLNVNFVQPLRDLISRNASGGGLTMKQARSLLKDYIGLGKDASGKLKSYILQTSQQAVSMYSGAINKKLMDTFDYNGMLITGTIIDNSSPQCIYCIRDLGGTIRRSDWPDVKEKATNKFKLIEGTTFDNLPIMLLHWGCRHGFYPIML